MKYFFPSMRYFKAPLRFFNVRELKRTYRFFRAIVLKGDLHAVELSLILLLLTNGTGLTFAKDTQYLQTLHWPIAYIFVALIGIGALATRDLAARMWFAFLAFQLRVWVIRDVLLHDPQNILFWLGMVAGATMAAWVCLRHLCAIVEKRQRDKLRKQILAAFYSGEHDRRSVPRPASHKLLVVFGRETMNNDRPAPNPDKRTARHHYRRVFVFRRAVGGEYQAARH
jgi:hypothetical protein